MALPEIAARKEILLSKNGLTKNEIDNMIEKKDLKLYFQSMTVLANDVLVMDFLADIIDGSRILKVYLYIDLDDICDIEDTYKYKGVDTQMCTKNQLKKISIITRIKLRILYIIYAVGKEIKDTKSLLGLKLDPDKNIYVKITDYGNSMKVTN